MVQCQSMSLQHQLDSGIRVLDIRCRHIDNVLTMHHGRIYLHLSFGHVLSTLATWLAAHPREAVLMRVRQEHRPAGNSRSFEDTYKSYMQQYRQYMWEYREGNDNPSLGQIRGRVVLLQNFASTGMVGGLMAWGYSTMAAFGLR